MAVIPVILSGVFYPKGKAAGDQPKPGTFVGNLALAGLSVGGGPILPPDQVPEPEPPLEIWPNPPEGTAPHPEHPIVLPDPITPPDKPPSPPEKPHEGWNWKPSTPNSPTAGWYYLYIPGQGAAQPKK